MDTLSKITENDQSELDKFTESLNKENLSIIFEIEESSLKRAGELFSELFNKNF